MSTDEVYMEHETECDIHSRFNIQSCLIIECILGFLLKLHMKESQRNLQYYGNVLNNKVLLGS